MSIKRVNALLLAVTVLLCTVLLCACNDDGEAASGGEATYKVTVLDAAGKPGSGIIVKFMQGDKQIAMQPVDASGVATKKLEKGDYTLQFVYTADNSTAYCDEATATVSASKTATTVTLYKRVSGEGIDLVTDGKNYKAYPVTAGGNYVSVTKQTRNYFLFVPTEAGTYQISIDNKNLVLGCYGTPYFVQSNSIAEVKDGVLTISVSQSMIGEGDTGTATYVIGIDGLDADTDCLLNILRTGDPEWSVEDEPWTEYKTTHTPAPFTLEGGKTLTYVDIKGTAAENQVIYNEQDGYYHFGTATGPVVYVNLGKNSPNVSLQIMIQGDGPMGGAPLREYFFDENGKFLKKEDYTAIMATYFENMDQTLGIYPLNKDLVYIIQNGCSGWWDAESPDYILEGCNPEIGWMFALCYVA